MLIIDGWDRGGARRCRSGGRLYLRWLLVVWLVAAALMHSAQALEPGRQLAQYHHRVFTPRDNTPTAINALAQTEDGYLWVGTATGLYRFDGVTFELMSSLDGQNIRNFPVICLVSEPGGGLWIGYGGAGGGYYKAGHYTHFGPDKGWHALLSGAVDPDGVLWAVIDGRLARVEHLNRQELGAAWGVSEARAMRVVIDKAGTVWVGTASEQGVMYLPRHETRFMFLGGAALGDIAAAPDGTIWGASMSGLTAVITRNGRPERVVVASRMPFGHLLIDRDGGLFATVPTGLAHISDARRLLSSGGDKELVSDVLTPSQGLSSETVWNALEDSEGSVWIATSLGLDRFRNSRFTPLKLPGTTLGFAVASDNDGAVWAGNWAGKLLKVEARSKISVFDEVGPRISALYRDPSGSIWAGGPVGLWQSEQGGKFVRASIPKDYLEPSVNALAMDSSRRLWLSGGKRLVQGSPSGDQWVEPAIGDGFPARLNPRSMAVDSADRTWLGNGRDLVRIDHGKAQVLTEMSKALHVGAIESLFARGDHVWIGGAEGIAFTRGDHVVNLKTRDGALFSQIAGLVETASGDLWARGADEAWHVPAAEVSQALRSNAGEVSAQRFDALDGLIGMATTANPRPTLVEAKDGVLWFAGNQGLAWVDPTQSTAALKPPALQVQSLTGDGVVHAVTDTLTLAPRTQHVEIAYTAVELGYPERIKFRYRLEGVDRSWQFADTRRVAYYNDLPPGDYRFHVSSTDQSGRWMDGRETVMSFRASPAWFQTTWFKLLAGMLVIGLITVAYRLRLRQLAAHLHAQLQEQLAERDRLSMARQAERDRIARELHDTLLQGVNVLIWRIQSLAQRIPEGDPLRGGVDEALKLGDRLLVEGRERVQDLRTGVDGPVSLVDQLQQSVDDTDRDPSIAFIVRCEGTEIELLPRVHAEIVSLSIEALRNAFAHARARSVELSIDYGIDAFSLQVADDGIGIPGEVVAHGKSGHWGLAGMKERAGSIGASFHIVSGESGGTAVTVSLPAVTAYGDVFSHRSG